MTVTELTKICSTYAAAPAAAGGAEFTGLPYVSAAVTVRIPVLSGNSVVRGRRSDEMIHNDET